jgi:hypothetical protein
MTPLTTDQKGRIAFLKVQIEARMKGAVVLVPTTPERYDLVLHYRGRFYRAQVKYADAKTPHSRGAVRVDLRRRKRCYTQEEIDVLLVYIRRMDKFCWFWPPMFHNKPALHLRTEPAGNNQRNGCWMVDDFVW